MVRPASSLQTRVIVLVLSSVAVMWIVASAMTWFDAKHQLDELLDGHLAQAATLLIAQSSLDENEHSFSEPESKHKYSSRVAFQMWHEGKLRWRSANAPSQPMTSKRNGFDTASIDGETWRVFATRGAESDVNLFVGERVDARDDILYAVLGGILMPLALGLPLLGGAALWAVRSGLAPMRSLERILRERAPEALGPVELAGAPREIDALLNALNSLFTRISTLLDNERRFTQDAAHELRTPIAAIRTQAQVALGATGDAERRHALQNTVAGCDRASHLVDQLLTLARLESQSRATATSATRFDLCAVTRQVVADLAPLASAKQQVLSLDALAECPASGDPALIAVLIRNLVDNAIRYSPMGARVRVILTNERRPRLTVEDSGPGLSTEVRHRLGERFFRFLGSGEDGSGLGWSIVRRVALVFELAIDIQPSARLSGLAVSITWPATGL